MTGIYVRVQLDAGGFDSKEIDELTETELDRFIESQRQPGDNDLAWKWVKGLVKWIREHVIEAPS